jgi:arylsulfatase A-like enzyme
MKAPRAILAVVWRLRSLGLVALGLALAQPACRRPPTSTVYDLAADSPLAEWIGPEGTRMSASPVTEVDYGEPRVVPGGKDRGHTFASALDVRLFVTWTAPAPREAALCLESSPSAVAVEVTLNRTSLGTISLRRGRHTYRLRLPADAQHVGVNRLRLTFEPGPDIDVPSGEPFHGALVARVGDPAVERLVASDLAPFERGDGSSLRQWAPGNLRYALRLPERAELHLGVRGLAGAAPGTRYEVILEPQGGVAREILTRTLPREGSAAEQVIPLRGRPGDFAWLTLRAEPGPDGLARVEWTAPRVSGVVAPPAPPVGAGEAKALRARLRESSVILIVLDAARAREFSTYGYGRPTTLEIDRLAREGVVFEQAYTPATYTISAMSSVWTSLYHEQHHYGVNFRGPMPGGHPTLAEVLGACGVKTMGFIANPAAGHSFGLDRGFSEFRLVAAREGRSAARAGEMVAAVAPHLDELSHHRSFLYIHFLEPHFPYNQPDRFVTMFGPDTPLTPEERHSTHWITDVNRRRRPFTPEERAHLVRLYDGNLAYVDREVGRLRRILEDKGLLDRVVLIVTADHGDELYERGQIGHGGRVYEETLHIPLVMRFPKGVGPAGVRVKTLVDLLDLAPTILDVMGLAGAKGSEEFEGRSLLPVIFGHAGKPMIVGRTMQERPSYSFRDGPWKLIYSVRSGQAELYQLANDPGETRGLAATQPVRADFYRETLCRWLRGLKKRPGVGTGPLLSPEDEKTLRALGYLN